jgi:uncharacterized protein YjbJ (UPF0337 family)
MNWNLIEGNWSQLKGSVGLQWDRLSRLQLDSIAGKRKALALAIEQAYGISGHAAEWQLSGWQARMQ